MKKKKDERHVISQYSIFFKIKTIIQDGIMQKETTGWKERKKAYGGIPFLCGLSWPDVYYYAKS